MFSTCGLSVNTRGIVTGALLRHKFVAFWIDRRCSISVFVISCERENLFLFGVQFRDSGQHSPAARFRPSDCKCTSPCRTPWARGLVCVIWWSPSVSKCKQQRIFSRPGNCRDGPVGDSKCVNTRSQTGAVSNNCSALRAVVPVGDASTQD